MSDYNDLPPDEYFSRDGKFMRAGTCSYTNPDGTVSFYWDEIRRWAATDPSKVLRFGGEAVTTVWASRAMLAAVQQEREACAIAAEKASIFGDEEGACARAAAAIRARTT